MIVNNSPRTSRGLRRRFEEAEDDDDADDERKITYHMRRHEYNLTFFQKEESPVLLYEKQFASLFGNWKLKRERQAKQFSLQFSNCFKPISQMKFVHRLDYMYSVILKMNISKDTDGRAKVRNLSTRISLRWPNNFVNSVANIKYSLS